MRRVAVVLVLSVLALTALCGSSLAQVSILRDFAGAPNDGGEPLYNSLVRVGSGFYGMTTYGGANDAGVIFRINSDGSGFELLHEFAGGADDGAEPYGGLLPRGATFYGMTAGGGDYDIGVIFKINSDGSGFELLHEFSGGAGDGDTPYGSLISDGSALYGVTAYGGAYDEGAIFKINPDGSGFELLHEFAGGAGDGAIPLDSLILVGSALYGMTANGGDIDGGTIFAVNTDGTGYELLHEFTSVEGGVGPEGSLVSDGSRLYGMTMYGGAGEGGALFRIDIDGSGFRLLHEFVIGTTGTEDGFWPDGSLTLDGATLYGVTRLGGADIYFGVIFSINTNGTGYELLHEFAGPPSDGANPNTGVIVDGSKLYGMAAMGGADDYGVIYSLSLITPQSIPTLSGWGVIILAGLLALAALALLKRGTLKPTRLV